MQAQKATPHAAPGDRSIPVLRRSGIGSEYGFGPHHGFSARFRMKMPGFVLPSTLVCSGRSAIGVAVRYAQRHSPPGRNCVLLPSYLCHTIIQPCLELGAEVAFYPVGGDLMIDARDIARRIDRHTMAVLILDYFGFPQDPGLTQRLLAEFPDVHLIDDRTHTLLSDLANPERSDTGAIIVYSARKWAPFPDLGIVRWPTNTADEGKDHLLDAGCDLGFFLTRLAALVMRSVFLTLPCEIFRRCSLESVQKSEHLLNSRCVLGGASPVSRLLWSTWDWRESWDVRRRNFGYLLEHWPRKAGRPLYGSLSDEICPLGFPVRTSSRSSLKERLIQHQVYPPVHWLLPKQVDPSEFPDAARLADEELTIPIDQRYSLADMEHIVEAASRDEGIRRHAAGSFS